MTRRWLYVAGMSFALLIALVLATAVISRSGTAHSGDKTHGRKKEKAQEKEQFSVKVEQWGPTQEEIDKTISNVTQDSAVQEFLNNTDYRLIAFEYIDPDNKNGSEGP